MKHLPFSVFFLLGCGGGMVRDRVSPCNSADCPGTHSVDQAELELRDLIWDSLLYAMNKFYYKMSPAISGMDPHKT